MRLHLHFLVLIVAAIAVSGASASVAWAEPCNGNPDALGVSRTVEIDTSSGPRYGLFNYGMTEFLQPGEVVLSFDDGPTNDATPANLSALAQQCVKATFFSMGKHALEFPEVVRSVVAAGNTVGTHTFSHPHMASIPVAKATDQIELGVSAVNSVAEGSIVPFFRFPYFQDSPDLLAHLRERKIAVFSADVDSFDYTDIPRQKIVANIMKQLKQRGKGIVLMHDIIPETAAALPDLLQQLKANHFRIVHLITPSKLTTLSSYDAQIKAKSVAQDKQPQANP
jgi:peptidoglycan/xylan/chitin deacetylase (PgdA/CDA1 family)